MPDIHEIHTKSHRLLWWTLAVVWLLGLGLLFSASAAEKDECTYIVGVSPQFEKRTLSKVWHPLLRALSERTKCDFELSGSSSILDFENSFKEGAYDLAYMNPFHAIMAYDTQGYIPLVRSGAKSLRGVLTVHKNSGITNISQLDGKQLAFPSPNALGASLLMRADLEREYGVHIEPLYVKTHSSVYLHVAKHLVAAGGGVQRTLQEQEDRLQDMLRVIHTTTPVPAHPLTAHPRIGNAHMEMIQNAWLDIAKEQPHLTYHIPMESPIKASLEDYSPLREMGLHEFTGESE